MEYVGAALILLALTVITLANRGKEQLNDDGSTSDVFLAIFFTILCSISWAGVGAAAKYASYYYDSVVEEYSMISCMVSGIGGSLSIILIYIYGWELDAKKEDMQTYYMASAWAAGFFTVFGLYSFMKALSYGSVGVAALFANMQIVFELIEEFFIFQILPSFFSFVGIWIALIGSAWMIIFQHKNGIDRQQNRS